MWHNTYKDYKQDESWIQEKVETGNGIIGCEMNELNGWGEIYHHFPKESKKNFFRRFLENLFKRK